MALSKDDPLFTLVADRFTGLIGLAKGGSDRFAEVDLDGAERCLGSLILKADRLKAVIVAIKDSE